MTDSMIDAPDCIALLGGTGFLGQALARRLDAAGYAVRVLTRRPTLVPDLAVLPRVQMRRLADPRDPAALAEAMAGCAAVVNLVGILHETRSMRFDDAHVALTQSVIDACRQAGVDRLLQVSALGASEAAPSRYLRSKAAAEQRVAASGLAFTIFRPSVIFGRADRFINLFATLARNLPVLVLACPEARFQPVHVEDVAEAITRSLVLPATVGMTLELGGPEVLTLHQLITRVCGWVGAHPPIIGLGAGLSMLQASIMEWMPAPLMTRDNVRSMQVPNVCSGPFPAVLGFVPAALDAVVPAYLAPISGRARYGELRQHAGRE